LRNVDARVVGRDEVSSRKRRGSRRFAVGLSTGRHREKPERSGESTARYGDAHPRDGATRSVELQDDGYRALADPTLRRILRLLREGDLPAGAIAEQFEMSWRSVSRHLGVLASAGLVTATRRGQQLVYSLTTSVLADIVTELADMARVNDAPTGKAPKARRSAATARGHTNRRGERDAGKRPTGKA